MDDDQDAKRLAREARQKKKEDIARQMAKLAAEAAELAGLSDADELPPSPSRKRKSDVLAEASPVKHKAKIRDDTLVIRPLEKKKLEFSGSLVNKTKSETEFNGSSTNAVSRTRPTNSRDHQASSSRLQDHGSSASGSRSLSDLLSREEKPKRISSSHASSMYNQAGPSRDSGQRKSLSTSMRERSGSGLPRIEPERNVVRGSKHAVKSEDHRSEDPAQPSRLSSSLASRRRAEGTSDGEGSNDSKRFGKRDAENLTVIEDLKTGPIEFGRDPEGMAEWTWVEPNSGINLSQRLTSHNDVQETMTSRYYLSPSKLYSVIRLSRDRQHYDVPLDSDWVTIAIVCGKSEIRNINGGSAVQNSTTSVKHESDADDDDDDNGPSSSRKKSKTRIKAEDNFVEGKRKTRKFVNLRLCSLANKASRKGTSAGGDTLLTLLLFEAESESRSNKGDVTTRHYRGGSGGAYEKWWKLDVGSVIGIVAPKVLKPWDKGNQVPNPHTHPLGLTPSSAEDIFLIGRSQDLGQCKSIKRDGNRCEDWIDKRVSQYCEYHVHLAVKSGKAGRAEFASSTAGFDLRAKGASNVKNEFDPVRKTGLLPRNGTRTNKQLQYDNNAGGHAYIVGGKIISGRQTAFADEFVHEKMGREKGRKLKRKKDEKREEEALQSFLDKEMASGSTGAKYLRAIQELNNSKEKPKTKSTETTVSEPTSVGVGDEANSNITPFRAETIRKIGFNPAAYHDPLQGLKVTAETNKALDELRGRIRGVPTVSLGKMPGKTLSNVINPLATRPILRQDQQDEADLLDPVDSETDDDNMIDLD